MGRIGAKPIHQFHVQNQNDQHQLQPRQDYASQVESFDHYQAPESIESFHEDLYPEESQDEPSQELTMQSESHENHEDSVQQQQYVQAVTTQVSQQNGKTQRPRKQPKPKSGTLRSPIHPSQHNNFPIHDLQPQAEAFSTPQSQPQPHPFPPAQDYNEPHTSGTNFPHHSLAQGSQIGMGMGQYQQGMQPAPPMMGIPFKPLLPTESWKTGLFDCMEDPTNALITACFPCLTFGQIAEIVDSGQTPCTTSGLIYGAILMFIGMPCIMSCTYRTKLRSQYGLMESPAPDWVIHCFCECCALCQEYRELHHRGFDPSIGWQGNQAQKQNMQLQQAMVPPVHQAMMG